MTKVGTKRKVANTRVVRLDTVGNPIGDSLSIDGQIQEIEFPDVWLDGSTVDTNCPAIISPKTHSASYSISFTFVEISDDWYDIFMDWPKGTTSVMKAWEKQAMDRWDQVVTTRMRGRRE